MDIPEPKYASYPSLKDKVIVISGGATGIGASLTISFALQSSQVIILDIQSSAAAQLIQHLSENSNVRYPPIFHYCNVININDELKPTTTKILSQFPHIHGVINNAANDLRQSTLDITTEQWDQGIAVNLRHQFFLTQALMPGLIAAGSSAVINMGSISWAIPATGLVPYVASKSALVGLTKTLAHEFGEKGVRVVSIMPGAIATERQKKDILTPEYEELVLRRQALKRLLEPHDVARLALWLVADDGSAVTNQSFVVDGGWI